MVSKGEKGEKGEMIISMTFVLSQTQMLVCLSLYTVCDAVSEHRYFDFCMCGRTSVLCLFG